MLLDCGNGVFSKLRRFRDYVDVDAVVLSHLHADHFLDLVPFAYALTYAPRQQPVPVDRWPGTDAPARPRARRPAGRAEVCRRVAGAWGPEDLVENAFDLREYDAADTRRGRPAAHALPRGPALPADVRGRRDVVGQRRRAASPTAPTARRPTSSSRFAARHRPAHDRGDAAAPRARGRRAATSRRRRPATTAPAPSAGRLVLTHISDELDELWARAEARGGLRRRGRRSPREGAVYEV